MSSNRSNCLYFSILDACTSRRRFSYASHSTIGLFKSMMMSVYEQMVILTVVTKLENASLDFDLCCSTFISRYAIIVTQIWILMAFSLSPRKYFRGKFCFTFLMRLCKALHKTFYVKCVLMQSQPIRYSGYQIVA